MGGANSELKALLGLFTTNNSLSWNLQNLLQSWHHSTSPKASNKSLSKGTSSKWFLCTGSQKGTIGPHLVLEINYIDILTDISV